MTPLPLAYQQVCCPGRHPAKRISPSPTPWPAQVLRLLKGGAK